MKKLAIACLLGSIAFCVAPVPTMVYAQDDADAANAAAHKPTAPRHNPAADEPVDTSPIDPLHPFANVKRARDWIHRFKSYKPNMDPNDPYNNISGGDIGRYLMGGGNFDHPGRPITDIKGTGGNGAVIRSPYPFKTAQEQYDAWLKAANGGTKMTRDKLPDWSGDWLIAGSSMGGSKISEELAAVSDAKKPEFVKNLRAEWLEHGWGAGQYCLPGGFMSFWGSDTSTWHFMSDQHMVEIGRDRFNEETRWIFTDGRGFLPAKLQFPQWYGESIGFWDGDALVVMTNQIKAWKEGNVAYSGNLQAVERIQKIGDEILVDETMYDPESFAYPWHNTIYFKKTTDWTRNPTTYQECVSTNNVHLTEKGEYDEYAFGDVNYKQPGDDAPWDDAFKRWDDAHPDVPQWKVPDVSKIK